ncbi:DASH family cryptochrome [Spirosoma montaniterrae]|uniref:Cryptochrome DASH n=1 Tax=Spirosoma montaniterrae TaxID=1178516 RepID=A0A1P9X2G5_9BACT|nr:DASH family cryptochrome [Spirosoma montaniterrae]AQG81812.1 cryptochrome DASH [Spirosoma montaniterrae]
MKRILYWFRNDLRLHDNEGFARAVADADAVLPVFVFDLRWFKDHNELGFTKTGVYRTNFLIEAVTDLRRSLQANGADLIIRVGNPATVLADLAETIGAEAIYASKEVTQEETDVESDLSKQLKPLNIDIELFWQSTLYHVRDLPFSVAKLPDVFSQFRNKIEKYANVRDLVPTPGKVRLSPDSAGMPVSPGPVPTLATLGFSGDIVADVRAAVPFKGGETVALTRLMQYVWEKDLIRTYKETRNGMLGEDYSSKFSAWLSMGCLSPRQVYWEVQRYEQERVKNDSTYWLIFELIWRDFFRFVALRYGTRLFKPSGIRHDMTKKWRRDRDLFLRWAEGETGIPFIDANMRELNATGFMSNRGRQNVGSFLVKDLGIDWTWGAAYFESLLVDYDPCSNWGNWNYVAGVGNDPREDRYFNIYSQATRYDEQGQYVKHWLPELARVPSAQVHLVSNLSATELAQYNVRLGDSYPLPVISPAKWLKGERNR